MKKKKKEGNCLGIPYVERTLGKSTTHLEDQGRVRPTTGLENSSIMASLVCCLSRPEQVQKPKRKIPHPTCSTSLLRYYYH